MEDIRLLTILHYAYWKILDLQVLVLEDILI